MSKIDWPDEDFNWNGKYNKYLPLIRGTKTPHASDFTAFSIDITFDSSLCRPGDRLNRLQLLSRDLNIPLAEWDLKTTAVHTTTDALANYNRQQWLTLTAQCLTRTARIPGLTNGHPAIRSPVCWLFYNCSAHQGLTFTLSLVCEIFRAIEHDPQDRFPYQYDILVSLRELIALSDDNTHDQVIAFLDKQAGSSPLLRRVRALCCPHKEDWATASAADQIDLDYLDPIESCVLPATVMQAIVAENKNTAMGHLYLHVYLHGKEAIDVLILEMNKNNSTNNLVLELICKFKTPRSIEALTHVFNKEQARKTLLRLSRPYPAAILKCMIERVVDAPTEAINNWTIRLALAQPDALSAALSVVSRNTADQFTRLLPAGEANRLNDDLLNNDELNRELPDILHNPPWLTKKPAKREKPLRLQPIVTPAEVRFPPAQLASIQAEQLKFKELDNTHITRSLIDTFELSTASIELLMQGETLPPEQRPTVRHWGFKLTDLLYFPDKTALGVVNSVAAMLEYKNTSALVWNSLFCTHGVAALSGFNAYVGVHKEQALALAIPVNSIEIAKIALEVLHKKVASRSVAKAWIKTHPRTTMLVAIPAAFGRAGSQRDAARRAVRWFDDIGFRDIVTSVAGEYGADAENALAAFRDTALLDYPARIPILPDFFVPVAMRKPVLIANDQPLPHDAILHLGTMLSISSIDTSYDGIKIVKHACTAASLADFAWDLYQAWLDDNAPKRSTWAFHALGHLGSNDTADELVKLIKPSSRVKLQQRAITCIDLLSLIGTERCWNHLSNIIANATCIDLQERAQQRLNDAALKQGLSAEQFSDRLVPTFGLDENGSMALDFGPRQLRVGFDESLTPYVIDEKGVLLKDLPKARQSDDRKLSNAATKIFRKLKKDVKSIAPRQVARLEEAMCNRHRWRLQDCRQFVLDHPLLRQLAARLVWGVYSDERLLQSFRLAEDFSYANAEDEEIVLESDAIVGIAFPTDLTPAHKSAFSEIFAEYEIMQPFEQLGRQTYTLQPEELAAGSLERFATIAVTGRSILDLTANNWKRNDQSYTEYLIKKVEDDYQAALCLEPGLGPGAQDSKTPQTITELQLSRISTSGQLSPANFDTLHPVSISELLRDAHLLVPAT